MTSKEPLSHFNLTQLPFYPANRAPYTIEALSAAPEEIFALYPELFRCVACNACTKACPMDIEVMDYIAAAKRGDIEAVAKISFDCIQCGLCAMRCPAEIVPYNIGQLARRLYSKYVDGPTQHVLDRVKEIGEEVYDEEINELMKSSKEDLVNLYNSREIDISE